MAKLTFSNLAAEMARLQAEREAFLVLAFEQLCLQRPALSDMLLERFGTASRAARWMARRQRVFGDRSGWDLLGEGDEDGVWDLVDQALYPDPAEETGAKHRFRQH
jgi:hypothetical protein